MWVAAENVEAGAMVRPPKCNGWHQVKANRPNTAIAPGVEMRDLELTSGGRWIVRRRALNVATNRVKACTINHPTEQESRS